MNNQFLSNWAGTIICGVILLTACSPNTEDSKVKTDASQQHTQYADVIINNARIYSLNWDQPNLDGTPAKNAPHDQQGWHPDATSIAIAHGKILAIGNSKQTLMLSDKSTQLIDLNGAVVVPGLVDSHVHIAELGELLHRVNLTDVATPEDAVLKTQNFAQTQSSKGWIIGQGWDEGAWANNYPTKELLDKAFPDRPVALRSLHGFAIWVNSAALQKAGINSRSKSPVGGEILLNESGEPSGVLLNNATNLIKNALPQNTPQQFQQYVFDGLKQMAQDGYVSVHQAGADNRHMVAFENLRKSETLPIRVYSMISARDELLANSWKQKGPFVDPKGWLDVRSVKAYYDGALGSRGARLFEDYSDRPGHKGISGDGYGFNKQIVSDLLQAGFQVGVHAIGDAGNNETLDFFESVFKQYPAAQKQRNRIEHAQVISIKDQPRFAKLDIIASMEPPHAVEDKTWAEDRLGATRIKTAYAWRSLRQQQAALVLNSDLPGSDHSIFYGLHSAITRQDKTSQPENGWYPEQNLSPEEALRGYTDWAAYSAFRENDTGTLAVGKWADLTVMDIDPLVLGETAPEKILKGTILMTMVEGKVVYQFKKLD